MRPIELDGATLFLGLTLGVLCEASTILNPKVLILLVLEVTRRATGLEYRVEGQGAHVFFFRPLPGQLELVGIPGADVGKRCRNDGVKTQGKPRMQRRNFVVAVGQRQVLRHTGEQV